MIALDHLTDIQKAQLFHFRPDLKKRLWKFRACPKCKGDMFPDEDEYNKYYTCLQCGWRSE